MNFTAIVASVLLTGYVYAQEDVKILNAIGMVESGNNPRAVGDHGKAYGAYQMHYIAWVDANMQLMREGKDTYSFSEWRKPMVQDIVGLAYIRSIRSKLKSAGISNPTCNQIALCWNLGFTKAHRINFNSLLTTSDYAERVQNIYNQNKTK